MIGYETGQIVLWDLRTKAAEMRWNSADPLRSISWHHEGKQFICSHTDGSLTTWNVRQGPKPVIVNFPHGEYKNSRSSLICMKIKMRKKNILLRKVFCQDEWYTCLVQINFDARPRLLLKWKKKRPQRSNALGIYKKKSWAKMEKCKHLKKNENETGFRESVE